METKMIDKDIKIELIPTKYIEIDKVKKADYNPRKINKKDFENLKNSIKKAGCIRDLVINKRTNKLIKVLFSLLDFVISSLEYFNSYSPFKIPISFLNTF